MLTYLNLTLSDLEDYFKYERDTGRVYLRRSGKLVTSCNSYGLVSGIRQGDKIIKLSMGKMCYFMIHQVSVDSSDKIIYLDKDYTNLKPNNLELVKYVAPEEPVFRLPVVEVDRRIFYSPTEGYYILRRNRNQASYCSYDLKEVISVRDEWELDNSIHKWDKFSGKYAEYL